MSVAVLPENAHYFQINGLRYEVRGGSAEFDLVDPIGLGRYRLTLTEVYFLTMSRTDVERDDVFQIGSIELTAMNFGAVDLAAIGFGFSALPDVSGFRLSIEGDIVIQALAGAAELSELPAAAS